MNATPMNIVELPSRQGLLNRAGIALAAALLILVFFVLPAEFQIDPTHFGRLTGLNRLSQPDKPALNTTAAHSYNGEPRNDVEVLTLLPGESFEYKVKMKPDAALVYSWTSTVPLEYDFHGEADKDPGNAVSYQAGTGTLSQGSLIAPFQGIHGWYWKNNTKDRVDIKLKMVGQYEVINDFSDPEAPVCPPVKP